MTNNLISIIIPVFNGEKYLAEAIQSVLEQKYRPIEIVVIDDGSTDNTRKIVKHFMAHNPIQYTYQNNQGLAASRNKGISLSEGELIAFNDADDVWEEKKLISQIEIFQKHPQIEMVSGKVIQFISPEIPTKEHLNYIFIQGEIQSNMMGAVLMRKTVFEKYGFFDQTFNIGQDMNWVLQAKSKGLKIEELPRLVYNRRLHPGNLGRTHPNENYKTRFKILKQAIDQRRRKTS